MITRDLRLAYLFLRVAALEDRIELLVKKYPKVPEEGIRKLATLDPTEGKYLEWLISKYDDLSPYLVDMNSWNAKSIREMLVFYDKVKKSSALRERIDLPSDINKVDLSNLFSIWIRYRDIDLASERQRIEKAKKLGAKVLYDKNGYKIIRIETNDYGPLAACIYAKGTKWCTSDESKAALYLKRDPLYIMFKDGQKILQTDLRDWKDLADQDFDIMNNDEVSQVFIDSGLLEPGIILWNMSQKYYGGAPRWPAVEPLLAQDPKSAYDYALKTGKPFKLGEPAIASDPHLAITYAAIVLNGRRFLEAEETLKQSPKWWNVYTQYLGHQFEKKEQEVSGSRSLRLAYRLMRIAGLEERIQYYVQSQRVPEEDLRILAKADPTDGKYLGWLIRNIAEPKAFHERWQENTRKALEFYEKVSKSRKIIEYVGLPADISKISLDQLYNSWGRYKDEDLKSKAEEAKKSKSTAQVIYSKGPYKILRIGGEGVDPGAAIEATCAYSKGTDWCTRKYKDAKEYLEKGPLFLAFKGKERLFLANYRGSEIHDTGNEPIKFTDEIIFLLLESGLIQLWGNQAYPLDKADALFNFLVYYMDIYPYRHPKLLQYIMDNKLVSQDRMSRYLEVVGKRLPNVEAYIATDPKAALQYAKYGLNEPWPEGESAIKSVPEYWENYQKTFRKELANV